MAKKPRTGVYVIARRVFFALWIIATILSTGWVVSSLVNNEGKTKVWGQTFVRGGGEVSFAGVDLILLDGRDFSENLWPWIWGLVKIAMVSAIPALIISYLFWYIGSWFVKIHAEHHQGAAAHA